MAYGILVSKASIVAGSSTYTMTSGISTKNNRVVSNHTNSKANSPVHFSKQCCPWNVLWMRPLIRLQYEKWLLPVGSSFRLHLYLEVLATKVHWSRFSINSKGPMIPPGHRPHQTVHLTECIGNSWTACGNTAILSLDISIQTKLRLGTGKNFAVKSGSSSNFWTLFLKIIFYDLKSWE